MSARPLREIRIAVPLPIGSILATDAEASPTMPTVEYFVLEMWSDFTVRHPTLGTMVVRELWDAHREDCVTFLRTGEWHG